MFCSFASHKWDVMWAKWEIKETSETGAFLYSYPDMSTISDVSNFYILDQNAISIIDS